MIKLKTLIAEGIYSQQPDPSLGEFLMQNKVESLSTWLYHGSPYEGLQEMLLHGIYGTEHGEVAEHDAFSTSINSEVLAFFSEGEGETGLQFNVKDARVVVLDDIMTYLVTQLPGSGMEAEVDDEEEFQRFIKMFKVPVGGWKNSAFLPYNYLSSLGVDAFVYDYVWKRMNRGYTGGDRDESEICFIGNGITKLNNFITGIYVNGEEFDIKDKSQALQALEAGYD